MRIESTQDKGTVNTCLCNPFPAASKAFPCLKMKIRKKEDDVDGSFARNTQRMEGICQPNKNEPKCLEKTFNVS